MKKVLSILFILLMMCGCSTNNDTAAIDRLNSRFGLIINSIANHRTNNNTKYYSFYLPSDVQELEYSDNYHHLVFYSSDFIMNLNVNYILCNRYFKTDLDNPYAFISDSIIYQIDNLESQDQIKFNFCLYKASDKYYFSLYTNRFNFFGSTQINQVEELVSHLFEIVYNSELNEDEISKAYYLGTILDYDKPELSLISQHYPESGILKDLSGESMELSKIENLNELEEQMTDSEESSIDNEIQADIAQ